VGHWSRRWSRSLDHTNGEQIRRRRPAACDHTAPTAASSSTTTVAHSGWGGRSRWGHRLRRLGVGELLGDWCRWSCGRDLVIIATPAEIHDIGVVRILEDAEEIALAQTLAITSEQLARRRTYLTRAHRSAIGCFDGATHEVKCVFTGEP
jgi:hypothetical protein